MDYVCQKEMAVYTQIFHTQGETAHLERCVLLEKAYRKALLMHIVAKHVCKHDCIT